jgi:hypothetical protein
VTTTPAAPSITLAQAFAAGPVALAAHLDALKPAERPFRLADWQLATIAAHDDTHTEGLLETFSRAHFFSEWERINFRLCRGARESDAIHADWSRDRDARMTEAWAEYALAVIPDALAATRGAGGVA